MSARSIQAALPADVSRETLERLHRFETLFRDWSRRINLVAASTEDEFWTRHIADSAQLLTLAPDARHWADLGSGGGFPGMSGDFETAIAFGATSVRVGSAIFGTR